MKVKEFLEYFKDFDPESELEFDLFAQRNDGYGEYDVHIPLCVMDTYYLDETDTVCMTLQGSDELMGALGIIWI